MAARRASASSLASHDADNNDNPFNDNPNIFSDNYAESIAESFADSIDARSVNHRDLIDIDAASSPDTAFGPASEAPRRPQFPSPWASTNTRGSLRKPLASGTPVGQFDEHHSTNSPTHASFAGSASPARRSVSNASSLSFARSQSPPRSINGPSHPYAMYPQALGMSRSPSVATASTARPLSFTPGRQGPTHPYALYPQNVPGDSLEGPNSIPVGFPGHGQSTFQRRLGPEGEVQDIIGPDGHSEQLPPYTRWPEESAAKATDALLAPIGEAPNEPSSPEHALLFPRQPHNFDESQPEPVEQRRRGSERGLQPKYEDSDRGWKDLPWSEKKRQKVFGIPLWFFLVIMFTIVVIAAVCGGVIGGVLEQHQAADNTTDANGSNTYNFPPLAEVTVTMTTTTMIDASEVSSTPSALPALPTGYFKVDVGEQTSTSQNCLPSQDQRRAWSCSLNPDTFSLSVGFNLSDGGAPYLTMHNYYNSSVPLYGAQPPHAYGQKLKLALDVNNPDWGVAYQFQILYDKLVVVDSSYMSVPASAGSKRGLVDNFFPPSTFLRKQVTSSDKPWFCYWNQTLLEGFIYVENDTVAAASAAVASSLGAMTSTPTWHTSFAVPTDDDAESTYDYTVPYMTPDSATPTSMAEHARPYCPAESSTEIAYLDGDTLVAEERRDISTDACYPKRIKIEERRLWQAQPTSFCQQMETNYLGQMVPILDGNGNPIQIDLTESDPQDQPSVTKAKRNEAVTVEKRALPSSGCYCQWQAI